MVKKPASAWRKNKIREIGHTKGRFFAIMAIIALGVGFFAGLTVTKSAMVKNGDEYVKNLKMYDYRIISTLGITEEDVEYFSGLDGVKNAAGAVSADVLIQQDDGEERVYKFHSMTSGVNELELVYGRLPEKGNECAVDARAFTEADIGKTLKLSENNGRDTTDMLSYEEYTITAVVRSAAYLNIERGTTKLGDGTIKAFVYTPAEGFKTDYFTEAYVTLEGATGEIFSDEYDDAVSAMEAPLTDAAEKRADERYQSIVSEANDKIADAEDEYNSNYDKYIKEKENTEKKLSDAEAELADAREQIAENEKKLDDARRQLDTSRAEYEAGVEEYNANLENFRKTRDETEARLASARQELEEKKAAVSEGISQIEDSGVIEQYGALKNNEAALMAKLEEIGDESSPEYQETLYALGAVQAMIEQIEGTGVIDQYNELKAAETQLASAEAELTASEQAAREQLEKAEDEFSIAESRLHDAKAQLDQGYDEIADGQRQLDEAKEQYESGLREYESAKSEAEEAFSDAERELSDARAEIDDAKKDVSDIEKPSVYVTDRYTNTGFACFQNDSKIVEGIARVFPLFFFLVAALVCMTTMLRMVEEQRTQIGTFKALGYSNGAIVMKYVSYSGLAAFAGCVIGFLAGCRLFPLAIWKTYSIYYGFTDDIVFVFNGWLAALSLGASMLCSAGTTYLACRRELMRMPAELMRPKAPKAGKRIFLERIGFIWKRIGFMHKVSIRNIVRYKQRLFMMILGIGGCTALVLTGFGINDSIGNVANDQYGEIMKYDFNMYFSDGKTKAERVQFAEDTADILSDCVFIAESSAEYVGKNGIMSVTLVATDDMDITNVIDLHSGEEKLGYPEKEGDAIISEKLSRESGASVGDTITIKLSDTQNAEFIVSGVCDNFVGNYIYMTEETYISRVDSECPYKNALGTAKDQSDVHAVSTELMNDYGAGNIFVTQDLQNRVENMMHSLNYVVILVIMCAAALAFVVLFNLSNINITERIREIATIKVLGFFDREVNEYVFRENFILTLFGVIAGLPMGIALHSFVMSQINIDMVSFKTSIYPVSFLYAVLMTFAFTVAVDLIMHKKLSDINMAESLKSVE